MATLFRDSERGFAERVTELAFTNPFLPERVEAEQAALGEEFVEYDRVWHTREGQRDNPNVEPLMERLDPLIEEVSQRLSDSPKGNRYSNEELGIYEELVLFTIYHRYRLHFQDAIPDDLNKTACEFYDAFRDELARMLKPLPTQRRRYGPTEHLFAFFFQIRRAFDYIFAFLAGSSLAMARLRANIWQSIFTHDLRRYLRTLYARMGDFCTLITGPSGTGKELVARAIAHSRYIPFDPKRKTFRDDFHGSFYPLNLSALSPTLIESELFGHRRGSFTGALEDRQGWLEVCPPFGTVFLDEIGDLDAGIQVKLLRVLQDRRFQRLGESSDHHFEGKVIAATHQDLPRAMRAGRFREDFYYRLCSDLLVTPSLYDQFNERPDERLHLIKFIALRLVPEEAETLTAETERWIKSHLGDHYPWPGNFRELEQCVRNVLVRKEYHPPTRPPRGAAEELALQLQGGAMTAEELVRRYCTWVYSQTHNYEETARRLGIDRRTVKSKLDADLLARLDGERNS